MYVDEDSSRAFPGFHTKHNRAIERVPHPAHSDTPTKRPFCQGTCFGDLSPIRDSRDDTTKDYLSQTREVKFPVLSIESEVQPSGRFGTNGDFEFFPQERLLVCPICFQTRRESGPRIWEQIGDENDTTDQAAITRKLVTKYPEDWAKEHFIQHHLGVQKQTGVKQHYNPYHKGMSV